MTWVIDDPEVERLATEIAAQTGETTEVAIRVSLREYRDRLLKQHTVREAGDARNDEDAALDS